MTEIEPLASFADHRIDDHACRRIQSLVELIGQRWNGAVLIAAARGARRFVDYRAMVDGISDRLLTVRLKELEAENLIQRTVIPSTPVQVRYSLTPLGCELITALEPLMEFALHHLAGPGGAPR